MRYMLLRLVFITSKKMDFKKGINYQLATLFGIGKLPGGGTWSSLTILLIALAENSAETATQDRNSSNLLKYLLVAQLLFGHHLFVSLGYV